MLIDLRFNCLGWPEGSTHRQICSQYHKKSKRVLKKVESYWKCGQVSEKVSSTYVLELWELKSEFENPTLWKSEKIHARNILWKYFLMGPKGSTILLTCYLKPSDKWLYLKQFFYSWTNLIWLWKLKTKFLKFLEIFCATCC